MVFPKLGFGAEEAAQDPFVAKERIDLETLFGIGGLEAGDVLVLERGKLVTILADDKLGVGVEPGFEGVLEETALPWGVRGPVDS